MYSESMTVFNEEKLSNWEKRPKQYLDEGVDEITKRFLQYCQDETVLDINYVTRDGRTEDRRISPKKVLKDYFSGKYYTEAYCHLREEIRVFHLKKISLQDGDGKKSQNVSEAIPCNFTDIDVLNDDGFYVDSVEAECGNCGHKTWSFGRSDESRKRCLALMQEECPVGKTNWYVDN